jgi:outer membrane protein
MTASLLLTAIFSACEEKAADPVVEREASPPAIPAVKRAPRWATVDMQRIFKEYDRTGEVQTEINVERARIQKENSDRLARVREILQQVEELRGKLDDPSIAESRRHRDLNEWNSKQQEGIALDRERREFLQRRNQSLNENMVQRMKGILDEIRKLVEEKAKTGDYDCIVDKSGLSVSQVPFFLHTPAAGDLTAILLQELNAGAEAPRETDAGRGAAQPVRDPD